MGKGLLLAAEKVERHVGRKLLSEKAAPVRTAAVRPSITNPAYFENAAHPHR